MKSKVFATLFTFILISVSSQNAAAAVVTYDIVVAPTLGNFSADGEFSFDDQGPAALSGSVGAEDLISFSLNVSLDNIIYSLTIDDVAAGVGVFALDLTFANPEGRIFGSSSMPTGVSVSGHSAASVPQFTLEDENGQLRGQGDLDFVLRPVLPISAPSSLLCLLAAGIIAFRARRKT